MCQATVRHASHYPCQDLKVDTLRWWWELKRRYRSVCVGSRYTAVDILSPWRVTQTSRKAIRSSFSSSMVNCILGHCWLRGSWKARSSSLPWVQMTKVSSTYQTQSLGWSGADWMALCSRSSMNRLAIMGERGEPMAAPSVCSKKSFWNWK